MEVCPCLDEALLHLRQLACYALHRLNCKDCPHVLIHGVEMGPVMRSADLSEHANRDTEKPTQLWHVDLVSDRTTASVRRGCHCRDRRTRSMLAPPIWYINLSFDAVSGSSTPCGTEVPRLLRGHPIWQG